MFPRKLREVDLVIPVRPLLPSFTLLLWRTYISKPNCIQDLDWHAFYLIYTWILMRIKYRFFESTNRLFESTNRLSVFMCFIWIPLYYGFLLYMSILRVIFQFRFNDLSQLSGHIRWSKVFFYREKRALSKYNDTFHSFQTCSVPASSNARSRNTRKSSDSIGQH